MGLPRLLESGLSASELPTLAAEFFGTAVEARRAMSWINLKLARGRYHVTAQIGEGGMGLVYKARDTRLETEVVIKAPRRALVENAEFARRFVAEIQSLVALTHPHVVRISDVGVHEGTPFAVMQFLGGGNLEQRRPVDGGGRPVPVDLSSFAPWLTDIAKALDFVHSKGFVHRDVKPANILFDEHQNVYLSDFGVIKAIGADRAATSRNVQTGTGLILGTPGYLAPEIILGESYDGRADQYALGIVLFELLAARLPFTGPTPAAVLVAQSTQTAPRLDELAGVPGRIARIVERALIKNPGERFSSCDEFAKEFLRAAQQSDGDSSSGAPVIRTTRVARPALSVPPLMPTPPPFPVNPQPEQVPAESSIGVLASPGDAMPEPVVINYGNPTHSARASWIATPSVTRNPVAKPAKTSQRGLLIAAAAAGLVLVLSLLALGLGRSVLAPPAEAKVTLNWDHAAKDNVRLTVDGGALKMAGLTSIRLAPGQHRLLLERRGYAKFETQFELAPAESKTIEVPTWQPRARIVLQWAPEQRSQAAVVINGSRTFAREQEFWSDGESQVFAVDPGQHEVRIDRRGAAPLVYNLELAEGDIRRVDFFEVPEILDVEVPGVSIDPPLVPPAPPPISPAPIDFSTGPVDLIALVDPVQDSWRGRWRKVNGSVVSSVSDPPAMLEIRCSPPEEYTLTLDVTRTQGNDALFVGLVAGGRQFQVILDGWPQDGFISGIEYIDGLRAPDNLTRHKGRVFTNLQRTQLVVSVSRDAVEVTVDGSRSIVNWKDANFARCSLAEEFGVSRAENLFLGAHHSEFEVHSFVLTKINLGGTPDTSSTTSPSPPVAASPPLPSAPANPLAAAGAVAVPAGPVAISAPQPGASDPFQLLGSIPTSGEVAALSLSASGGRLAYSDNEKVLVYNLAGNKPVYERSVQAPISVRISPDGRFVLALGRNEKVRVWDTTSPAANQHLDLQDPATVEGADFTPDSRLVFLTLYGGGSFRLLPVGNEVHNIAPFVNEATPDDWCLCAALSPDGKRALCGGQGILSLFDLTRTRETASGILTTDKPRSWTIEGTAQEVGFCGNSNRVFSLTPSRGLQFWDARTGQAEAVFPNPLPANKVAFSADGTRLLTQNRGTLELWDVASGKSLGQTSKQKSNFYSVFAIDPRGERAFALASSREIAIWKLPP